MLSNPSRPWLTIGLLAFVGCAPWAKLPPADYVTVESNSGQDDAEARKLYEKARKLMAKHIEKQECNLPEVEKLLQKSLACDVRFGPSHHALGMVYFWQSKLYLAAWEFEYAARVMPDRFEPLNNLGLVYEAAGKYDQAKMYYCLAREKAKINPEVIGNLARVSIRNGQTVDEVRPLLDDVIATDSRPAWRKWASDSIGLNPQFDWPEVTNESPAMGYGPEGATIENGPAGIEELPLIAPPPPPSSTLPESVSVPTKQPVELQPSLDLNLGAAFNDESIKR